MRKHAQLPWEMHDVAGAGIDIRAKIITLDKPITLFQLPSESNMVLRLNDKGEVWGSICYEQWVQFKSQAFIEMQQANAKLICDAVNSYHRQGDR